MKKNSATNEKDLSKTENKLASLLRKDIWKARGSKSERAERGYRNSLRNAIIGFVSLAVGLILILSNYLFSISIASIPALLLLSLLLLGALLIGIGAGFSFVTILRSADGLWRKNYPGPEARARAKKGFAIAWLALACFIMFWAFANSTNDFSYQLITGRVHEGAPKFNSKHYSWQRQLNRSGYFYGISGVDRSHIWAAGTDGIVFFDGKKWSPQYREGSDTVRMLHDVFALDDGHVWAVGERKTVLYFDGLMWNKMRLPDVIPSSVDVRSVSALTRDNVYAVGSPYLFVLNGKTWTTAPVDAGGHYNSVSAREPDNVWASGDYKFLRAEGTGWQEMSNDVGEFPHAICVLDKDHVWVAAGGAIHFFDGVSWHKQIEYRGYLSKIYALGNSDVWAVGWEDHYRGNTETESWYLCHCDGHTWELEYRSPEVKGNPMNARNNISGVYAPDPDHVWVVGDGIYLGTRKSAK